MALVHENRSRPVSRLFAGVSALGLLAGGALPADAQVRSAGRSETGYSHPFLAIDGTVMRIDRRVGWGEDPPPMRLVKRGETLSEARIFGQGPAIVGSPPSAVSGAIENTFGAVVDAERLAGYAATVRGGVQQISYKTPTAAVGRVVGRGDNFFLGDRAITAGESGLQLVLRDDSIFSMGPNASLIIDEYVYDPARGTGKITANLIKGAFRFSSGRIGARSPEGVTLKLRDLAQVGIRGTNIAIELNGAARVALIAPDRDQAAADCPQGAGAAAVPCPANRIYVSAGGVTREINQLEHGVDVARAGAAPTVPAPVDPAWLNRWSRGLGTLAGAVNPARSESRSIAAKLDKPAQTQLQQLQTASVAPAAADPASAPATAYTSPQYVQVYSAESALAPDGTVAVAPVTSYAVNYQSPAALTQEASVLQSQGRFLEAEQLLQQNAPVSIGGAAAATTGVVPTNYGDLSGQALTGNPTLLAGPPAPTAPTNLAATGPANPLSTASPVENAALTTSTILLVSNATPSPPPPPSFVQGPLPDLFSMAPGPLTTTAGQVRSFNVPSFNYFQANNPIFYNGAQVGTYNFAMTISPRLGLSSATATFSNINVNGLPAPWPQSSINNQTIVLPLPFGVPSAGNFALHATTGVQCATGIQCDGIVKVSNGPGEAVTSANLAKTVDHQVLVYAPATPTAAPPPPRDPSFIGVVATSNINSVTRP